MSLASRMVLPAYGPQFSFRLAAVELFFVEFFGGFVSFGVILVFDSHFLDDFNRGELAEAFDFDD